VSGCIVPAGYLLVRQGPDGRPHTDWLGAAYATRVEAEAELAVGSGPDGLQWRVIALVELTDLDGAR
jgi:hypothetical protein